MDLSMPHKHQLKIDSYGRPEAIKLLEENIGEQFLRIPVNNHLGCGTKRSSEEGWED